MEQPKLIDGGLAVDDRGLVRFVNDFDFFCVKRFYQVENHRAGFIRAWHGHKVEAKYAYVAKGSIRIGIVPLDNIELGIHDELVVSTLSSRAPKVLYIPANYANGFKTLEADTIVQFFSTTTLEESQGDDYRFSYDKIDIWDEDYR